MKLFRGTSRDDRYIVELHDTDQQCYLQVSILSESKPDLTSAQYIPNLDLEPMLGFTELDAENPSDLFFLGICQNAIRALEAMATPVPLIGQSEHLTWCKEQAMQYLDQGDVGSAWISMLTDMSSHEGTRTHPLLQLGNRLHVSGQLATVEKMKNLIQSFN